MAQHDQKNRQQSPLACVLCHAAPARPGRVLCADCHQAAMEGPR